MKFLTIISFLFFVTLFSFGQTVEETYPKTIWCSNDLFAIKYNDYPILDTFKISRTDKSSPGFDAAINAYAVIYFNNDSLRLNYNNKIPYQHNYYINFESPKGKTSLRFHFSEIPSYFSNKYMDINNGNVQFEIPETYELANIIWTLSSNGIKSTGINKELGYYKKVVSYFKPFLKHPIFNELNFADSLMGEKYYDFRENSFAFNFKDTTKGSSNCKLLFNGPYYYVYGNGLADSSLFGKLKPLVEDFAAKSNFRSFYKANLSYYKKEVEIEKILLPVKQMWKWLEVQFPKSKYQSYKIISSPLIGGSHSTQRYFTYNNSGGFSENVMFVCTAARYNEMTDLSDKQKEGLMSGIVFTEIDHNYVNPASGKYAKLIDTIFSKRNIWTKHGNSSDFYNNSVSVFNEYMTWAVFCLYIIDNYDKPSADFVINERESRMVEKRNFIRFKEFDQELIKLRQDHKNLKVVDLYPFILDWCKAQN